MAKAKTRARKPRGTTKAIEGGASAYSVKYVPVKDLAPYADNARLHSPAQIEALCKSFLTFGYTNPVMADASGIVAGHGRVIAMTKLYADGKRIKLPNGEAIPPGTIPVIDVSGWDDAQRRAYIIADNRLGDMSDFDPGLLKDGLAGLMEEEFDLGALGFAEGDLKNAMLDRQEGGTDAHAEWVGMPEFNQTDQSGIKVIVHFETEEDKAAFEKLVGQPIPKNTKAIWYPRKPWADMKAKQYVGD